MVAAGNTLLLPGTSDAATLVMNRGILGPPNEDYLFLGGTTTKNLDVTKAQVFRCVATATNTTTFTTSGQVDGTIIELFFLGSTVATTVVLPTIIWDGDPPNLTIPATVATTGTNAKLRLRWDAVINGGAGGWVEVSRSGWVSGWIAPALGANIANLGSGWATAGYVKNHLRRVRLKGLLAGSGLTSGATIFTLPAGYRPAENRSFMGYSYNGSAYGVASISVLTTGAVQVGAVSGTVIFSPMENTEFEAIQ